MREVVAGLYLRFGFIDEIVEVGSFAEILGDKCRSSLKHAGSVLIPHGTLISQMKSDEIEKIDTPLFGNKWILRWEADRDSKREADEGGRPEDASDYQVKK